MNGNNVVNFFSNLINRVEPEYIWRLVDIVYSKKHGHEICIMHLAGKSAFPKFTASELLSNPQAMKGMSVEDAVVITKLDNLIKQRKNKSLVLEVDKNGTLVLRGASGEEKRYAEKFVSSNRDMVNDMQSLDAHDLGYRVGFRDGISAKSAKKQLSSNLKDKLLKFIKRA